MLQFFSTPYPDELWYSALCRYHVRTGNINSAATFRELFEGKDHAGLKNFLPNKYIFYVLNQLPEGLLDIEDIALNHTLFKYAFRFQPLEMKLEALDGIRHRKVELPIKMMKYYDFSELKSCPVCMKEDIEQYGETYWHVGHQIAHVTACQKHKCRLIVRKSTYEGELNNNFFLPSYAEKVRVDYDVPPMELEVVRLLTAYLELPLETGPTAGYNNLYEGLLNAGYGIARLYHNYNIDIERISKDLCNKFGEKYIIDHFGDTYVRSAIFGLIRNWKRKIPDRYAILAAFIGQEPEVTFSPTRLENETNRRFIELSKGKIIRSKKYVAKTLGVTEKQLDAISQNLGIPAFGEQRAKTDDPKCCKLALNLTKSELDYINDCVERFGFASASGFIRHCAQQVRERGKI